MRKTTEELLNEIKSEKEIKVFIENNEDNFEHLSLSSFLSEMLDVHKTSRSSVLKNARMNINNYGYELFKSDFKSPSRDKIIQLCIGFPLTVEETQHALKCGGTAMLNPRNQRDSIIVFSIHKGMNIDQINELLYKNKEHPLF